MGRRRAVECGTRTTTAKDAGYCTKTTTTTTTITMKTPQASHPLPPRPACWHYCRLVLHQWHGVRIPPLAATVLSTSTRLWMAPVAQLLAAAMRAVTKCATCSSSNAASYRRRGHPRRRHDHDHHHHQQQQQQQGRRTCVHRCRSSQEWS